MKINRNHLTGLAVLAAFPTAVFASFYYHGRNHTELQNIPPQLIGIWDDWNSEENSKVNIRHRRISFVQDEYPPLHCHPSHMTAYTSGMFPAKRIIAIRCTAEDTFQFQRGWVSVGLPTPDDFKTIVSITYPDDAGEIVVHRDEWMSQGFEESVGSYRNWIGNFNKM